MKMPATARVTAKPVATMRQKKKPPTTDGESAEEK